MIKKYIILTFFLLVFSFSVKSQTMDSRALLNNLKPFWVLLENLNNDLFTSTGVRYLPALEQSYSFIQLELRDNQQQVLLEVKYQLQSGNRLALFSFYFRDKQLSAEIEARMKKRTGDFEWNRNPSGGFLFSPEQLQYLEIADRIAEHGNDIHGTPTVYGSIIITENAILLEQINHLNSRSLDHKDSYYMRDLRFSIPLKEGKTETSSGILGEYKIGRMEIEFFDGSAKSRKEAGDRIMEQLNKEIAAYKK